jgi:WD40 repeat protein
LWDVDSGELLLCCHGHRKTAKCVAISPDGSQALSASLDRTVRLWDLKTGREVRSQAGHSEPVWSVAFSPDGMRGLSGSANGVVFLWPLETSFLGSLFTGNAKTRRMAIHQKTVAGVAFSPDGDRCLSASYDETVKLCDLAAGSEIRCFKGHTNWVLSVAFSPDGRHALSGGADNTVRLWQVPK